MSGAQAQDVRPGRPRRSSREMLEEAAAELFLEQGYATTTVEHITQRAGVSRATFFNYFAAKSDLLWVHFDAIAGSLGGQLASIPKERPAVPAVREAVVALAAEFGPERIPWAVTERELIVTGGEFEASGLPRFAALARLIRNFVAERIGCDRGNLLAGAFAAAVIAAVASAAGAWAADSASRGSLAPYVDAAITPICEGFAALL